MIDIVAPRASTSADRRHRQRLWDRFGHFAMVVYLCACSGPAVVAPPANHVAGPAPIDAAAAEPTPCERYHALKAKADACTALSEEARQDLQQWETDMGASISESGMDGSTPVDEDRLCEEAAEHVLEVAKQLCKL